MDAVHNRIPISKIALPILAAALLLLAPGLALATTSFQLDTNSVSLVGNQGGNVNVTSSDGSTITYSATVNYPADQPTPWISINGYPQFTNPVNGLTTPGRVGFQAAQVPVDTTATVTFHATAPAGVTDVTVTVTYSPYGGGGGGGGTATLYSTPSSVTTDNSAGPNTTQQVTISTGSTTAVSFSLGSTTPATWLTVSVTGLTVTSSTTATLSLQFNSSGMAAGQYNSSVTLNYASGTLSIPVYYTVIASTVVTLTPPSVNWSYTPGGSVPSTTVTVTAGTTSFSAVVSASSPWIILSYPGAPSYFTPGSALYSISTSTGFIAMYNKSATTPVAGTQGTVTVSDANGHSTVFAITYNGTGGGGTGTVTVTPSPATMSSALNAGCCAQTTVTVNSTVSGAWSASVSNATCGSCFSVSPSSGGITAGTPVGVTIYGNSTGLSTGTYSGSLTVSVTANGAISQTTIQANLVVGGGGGGGGAVVAPTTLAFSADVNHPTAIGPQYVTIADQGGYSATVTAGSQWLSVGTASGSSGGTANPASLQVAVNPNGLAAGPYSGTVLIQSASGSTSVAVSLTVYNAPIIFAAAGGPGGGGTVNVTENAGNLGSVPNLYIYTSDSSSMNLQASIPATTTWLQLNQTSGSTPNNSLFPLVFTASNLPNGLYSTTVSITTPTAPNSPLLVPVVLSVGGSQVSSGLAFSQSSVNLNGTVNGSTTSSLLGVTASNTTSFTATASSTGSWLSVTPSGGTATTAATYITVIANPRGLAAGTYSGTVTVSGGGSQATAQVTFVVSTSGSGGGNVVSSQSSLTFTYQAGGTIPSSQSLLISNQASGTGQIAFTVSTAVSGGTGSWLAAAVNTVNGGTTGQTQATVVVSVSPASLPAGQYSGTVNIAPTGGSVLSIPVTLTVQGVANVAATPLQLTFSYQLGGSIPASQAVQVNGSATGLTYTAQASTISGSGWLSVNKLGGTTPDVLSVSVNPSGLAAGTSYTGTILVQGTGSATGTSSIAVSMTVTAPFPTITSLQSAASLSNGPVGVVSPGEIVTVFGTGLGPASPLQTAIDPTTGKVATTLGNVQVLFNGYPAPLTYVSASQINCVVPYELAQLTQPYVEVKFMGQASNAYLLTQAATAPGIFTIGAGSGQGAILNSDSSYNGTAAGFRPASAGSTIQIYMTGEGQTSPQGVTGKVNCPSGSACSISMLPVPLLAVAALVNNQPANITFFGEAPGFVSGVMQVDLVIPPGTPSGPASLVIKVGSGSSQPGVTVAVQ
jgi:uncharacterized protein (TIGR03437 family)